VNFVPFGKQQFREIRAVLSGNSSNQCAFHLRSVLPPTFRSFRNRAFKPSSRNASLL
jgi:hypothetical protein